MLNTSHLSATQVEERLEEYLKIDWRADQTEEQLGRLEDISRMARKESSPVNYFKCKILLANLDNGRDFESYNVHIHELDSIAKQSPGSVGDSLLIEYLLAKVNGLLLQRYVEEGYKCLVTARELSDRNPDFGMHRQVQNMFAYYFLFTAEYTKSLEIKKELHRELESKPISDTIAWVKSMGDLAVVYSMCGKFETSNTLLNKVMVHSPPGSREMATIYYRLGHNYSKLAVYDSSEKYLKWAILSEQHTKPGSHFIPVIQHSLARMYSDRGEFERSTRVFQQTLPQLDSLKLFRSLATAHLNILLNRLRGNSDTLGLDAIKSYRLAIDSLQGREKLEREQEFRIRYQTLEKEAEIRELELENQEEEAQKRALIILVLLALLAFGFIVYRSRSRHRITRQQLEIESLKRKSLSNELNQQVQLVNEKGSIIEQLREQLESNQAIDEILASLEKAYIEDKEWDNILVQFSTLHPGILEELHTLSKKITLGDQKLAVLIRLGYSTASISEVLNISKDGVRKARQRLRDKVGEAYLNKLTD